MGSYSAIVEGIMKEGARRGARQQGAMQEV